MTNQIAKLYRRMLPDRSELRKTWVARLLVVVAAALLSSSITLAGPTGEQVVHGTANFQRDGATTLINAANNTIIDYQSFNIAGHETVQFIQPGADARVLNRVLSANPSQINGSLLANGQVFLVNPSGIYFGNGATVNVGHLYAAAGSMTNQDFLSGTVHFQNLTGGITNHGHIEADSVALLGRSVANYGSIVARNGYVAMVAGEDVYLREHGAKVIVRLGAPQGEAGGKVENHGPVRAATEASMMSAGDMFGVVAHQDSVIEAPRVVVQADDGRAEIAGELTATGDGGRGGTIRVLGDEIALYGASLDAAGTLGGGEIHIGGSFQGAGPVPNARLTLVSRDSVINAGHDGNVVVWSDAATAFYGSLVNTGGTTEISSKGWLIFEPATLQISGGHLLLDPDTVTVQATDPDIEGDGPGGDFTSPGDLDDALLDFPDADSIITAGALVGVMDAVNDGTTITIAAEERINVDAAIVTTSTGPDSRNLELEVTNPDGIIDINSLIDLSNGDGSLTLTSANVELAADLIATALTGTATAVSVDGANGTLADAIAVSTAAGEIGIDTAFNLTGTINLDGRSLVINSMVTLTGDTQINTVGGDVTVNGTINGNQDLALNTTGTTRISGEIGGGIAVASLTTDAGGTTELGADVTAQGGTVTFNDPVQLTADVTVTDSGSTGITFGGTIDADDATANDRTLTLDAGANGTISVVGIVGGNEPLAGLTITNSNGTTFNSAVTVNDGTGIITLSDTTDGQTIAFQGDLTANTLTTVARGYDVSLTGAANTITTNTNFLNTGAVTLGDGGDVTEFTGGLDTTGGPSGTNLGGEVRTAGEQIDLNATTLTANSEIDSSNDGASASGAVINIASFTGGGNDLALISRTGATTVTGAASGLGTLALHDDDAQSTGPMAFQGDLTAITLTTVAQGYDVSVTGAMNTITMDTDFLNTGAVTLGDADTDVTLFDGGLGTSGNASNPSQTNLAGAVRTSGDPIDLGVTILDADTMVDATNDGGTPAGADVNFTGTVNGASALTADAGAGGTTTFDGLVGDTMNLTSLETDAGGTTAINASVTTTGTQTYNDPATTADGITLTGTTVTFDDELSVNAGAPGLLHVMADLELNGGLIVTLDGLAAGTQHDQIVVTGDDLDVDLGVSGSDPFIIDGASTAGTTFNVGDALTIIDVQSAGTTTASADPTTTVTSQNFGIDYANDVVLTRTATTFIWDGDTDNSWNEATNWLTDVEPGEGDSLIFPDIATANLNPDNNLLASVGSITFDATTDAYTLVGSALDITGGVTNSGTVGQTVNINLMLTADQAFDAANGGLTFDGTVDGMHDLMVTGGGAILFNSAVGGTAAIGDGSGAAIAITNTDTTEFNATVTTKSGITQADAAGEVTFRENVTVAEGDTASDFMANVVLDGLTYDAENAVTFGSDNTDTLTVSESEVTIATNTAPVEHDDILIKSMVKGPSALMLDAGMGNVTLEGDAGLETPLMGLVVDASTISTQDVTTSVGGMGIDLQTTNLMLDEMGQPENNALILINSTFNSNGAPVKLNADGRDTDTSGTVDAGEVPTVATLAIPDGDLVINTGGGDFTMGPGEKLTVANGNLTINAGGGKATLGDLSATGDITVNAASAEIHNRAAFQVLPAQGNQNPLTDLGTDIVASNVTLPAATTVIGPGSGTVRVGTVNVDGYSGPVGSVGSGTITQITRPEITGTQRILFPVLFPAIFLDLEASGVSPTSVAEALAGAMPREEIYLEQPVLLLRSQAVLLQQIGVDVRPPTVSELRDAIQTQIRHYRQAGASKLPGERTREDFDVAQPRLDLPQVKIVLDAYLDVYYASPPADGGEPKYRGMEMRQTLAEAVDAYNEHSDDQAVSGSDFVGFLRGGNAHSQALRELRDIARVLDTVKLLGLTELETDIVRNVLLNNVRPNGISLEEFSIAVDAASSLRDTTAGSAVEGDTP